MTTALAPAQEKPSTNLMESRLPGEYHEAYRMRLVGKSTDEICKHFGKSRVTIWRWCQKVEAEALSKLEKTPIVNIIMEQLQKLKEVELRAFDREEKARSDRAKSSLLATASRAINSQVQLLQSVGIIPREPDRVYQVIQNLKPQDTDEVTTGPNMSREQAIDKLVDALQNGRTL